MKLELKENAANKLWLPIVVVIFIVAISTCSCSSTESLTKPFYGDQMITRIDSKYVYTEDFLGKEIPHRIHKYDSTNYAVGKPLIYRR